jgi:hypothetical protein
MPAWPLLFATRKWVLAEQVLCRGECEHSTIRNITNGDQLGVPERGASFERSFTVREPVTVQPGVDLWRKYSCLHTMALLKR